MSQYDGPVPPRLQIPGAVAVGGPVRTLPVRNERVVGGQNQNVVRIRRPLARPPQFNALPIQPTRNLPIEEAKPVTEEHEEEITEPFVPQIVASPPQQPSPPQALFTNEPNFDEEPQIPRFQAQDRPAPQRVQDRYEVPQQAQRFNPNPRPVPAVNFIFFFLIPN